MQARTPRRTTFVSLELDKISPSALHPHLFDTDGDATDVDSSGRPSHPHLRSEYDGGDALQWHRLLNGRVEGKMGSRRPGRYA